MLAVIAHGYMEGNDAKSTYGGTRLELKIKKMKKKVDSKSDEVKLSNLKSDT